MTNEEIVEEIYHEAYELGFIEELRKKVDTLRVSVENAKLSHYEIVYKAYHLLKTEGLI
jgi:predicted translin family RNA/ssDNA-binding protein